MTKQNGNSLGAILISLIMGMTCLVLTSSALGAQQAADYKYAKRYSPSGKLLGEISPDADGDGQNFLAKRYVYDGNRPGLLIATEEGVLSSWQDETVGPQNWSGFIIHRKIQITYDNYGRKQTQGIATAGNTYQSLTQYEYDDRSRVKCQKVILDETSLHPSFLSSTACQPGGGEGNYGPNRITEYGYNNLDLVTEEWRAVGTPLVQLHAEYTYDGYLKTSVTDANGNYAKLEYDGYGRLWKWFFPSKTNVSQYNSNDYEEYTYDNNDNRLSLRKRDTKVIYYDYDNLNRVWRKRYSTSDPHVYYQYELQGLELHARFGSDSGSGIVRTYTGFGELATEQNRLDNTWYSVSHTYDENGNRTRVNHPGGSYFTYEHDTLDRLQYIREGDSTVLITNTWETEGPLNRSTTSGGAYKDRNYDTIQRLNGIDYGFAGSTHDLSQEFTYNPAGQLHTFDEDKRVFHFEGTGGELGSYGVNGLNQYTNVQGKTVGHDANGNMIQFGSTTYSYDVENRLLSASGATLGYDPAGRLIKYIAGGQTTWFLWDGDSLIAEYQNGNITRRYVYGMGLVPAVTYSGNSGLREFIHTNYQGSVIASSNASGVVLYANKYDAYGVPDTANQGRFGYTGQVYLKEIGLYHYRARVYDPKIGRFLQTDPVGYEDQMNLYAYVHNDPVNGTDPTGMYTSGGMLPNMAIYGLYGADGGNRYVNMINRSQVIGGAIGVGAAGVAACVGSVACGVVAGTTLTTASEGELINVPLPVTKKVTPNAEQAANLKRFQNKIPSNSKDSVELRELPNGGVAAQATSPGQVPGSKAVYEKQVDVNGDTVQATKTTYDPEDNIVHVKDKLNGGTYP